MDQFSGGRSQSLSPNVIQPLADALPKAAAYDSIGAITHAAKAIESFLDTYGTTVGVATTGCHGINAKIAELSKNNKLTKKLCNVGQYLGHVRNAADHGPDSDVGAIWQIRTSTGTEYVLVSCAFIAGVTKTHAGQPTL